MLQQLKECGKKHFSLGNNWIFIVFVLLDLGIWITGTNHQLFFIINSHHNLLPKDIWLFFNFIGYTKFFILTSILFLITLVKRRDRLINVILLIFAYYIVFALFKTIVGEARPYIVLPAADLYWLNNFENAVKSAYKSFPSGHTGGMAILAFACSKMFFANKKSLQFLMLLLVVIMGFSRICTGWHWPVDVITSGLIAYVLVKICFAFDLTTFYIKKSNYAGN